MRIQNFLVTVSCLTYNHKPYIEDAMNGFCMQQTDFPFICTIFDDNSTDGEQDIIKQYLENNFIMNDDTIKMTKETDDYTLIYTRHKTNANCFFAVYFLKYNHYQLKKSRAPYILQEWKDTKYIALCEGDDYWTDPEKLQMQVDYLEAHLECSLCFHTVNEIIEDDIKGVLGHTEMPKLEVRTYTGHEIIRNWTIPTCSVLYNVNLLTQSGYNKRLMNKNYIYGDIILFLSLAEVGYLYCISIKSMGVYRRHSGGVLMQCRGNYEKQIKHLESLKRDFGGIYSFECDYNISWMSFDVFSINVAKRKPTKAMHYLVKSFNANKKKAWQLLKRMLLAKFSTFYLKE